MRGRLSLPFDGYLLDSTDLRPQLRKRDAPSSLAVVPTRLEDPEHLPVDQLRELLDAGREAMAHSRFSRAPTLGRPDSPPSPVGHTGPHSKRDFTHGHSLESGPFGSTTTEGHSRRRFLAATATLGAAALAVCRGDVDGGNGGQSRELGLTLSHEDGPLHETRVVDLAKRDPEWDAAAFEAARDGETYTTQYRKPYFSAPEDPVYVLDEGTYYRLGSVIVDDVATTHPVLRLYDDETTATPADEPKAASALPGPDERAVRIAHMVARSRGNIGGMPVGLLQRGGYVSRNEEAAAKSRLLGADGPSHVTYRDIVYRVGVTEERFHEPVYRATAEPVADSPEGMEVTRRAKFVDAPRLAGRTLPGGA